MSRCPNCEYEAHSGDRYCPQCGMDMHWDPDLRPRSSVSEIVLVILGTLAGMASLFLGPGLIVVIIVYFSMRAGGSPFIRGIGIGLVILVALLLGAIAVCLASLSQWK